MTGHESGSRPRERTPVSRDRVVIQANRSLRPGQSWSLLGQATDWERRALAELEFYFESIAGTMQHFSDMQLRADDVRSLGVSGLGVELRRLPERTQTV